MYLYLLQNKQNNSLYIGVSINKERRIKEHNQSTKHYTGKISGDWELIACKWFENKTEARKEEIRLKKSRNKKYILWYFNQGR